MTTGDEAMSADALRSAGIVIKNVGWGGTTFIITVAFLYLALFQTDDRYRASDASADWSEHVELHTLAREGMKAWTQSYVGEQIEMRVPPQYVIESLARMESQLKELKVDVQELREEVKNGNHEP